MSRVHFPGDKVSYFLKVICNFDAFALKDIKQHCLYIWILKRPKIEMGPKQSKFLRKEFEIKMKTKGININEIWIWGEGCKIELLAAP